MAFEIIHEKPDEATRELREKLGFVITRIWTGQVGWVHESELPETPQWGVEQMVRDLYDEE
jgi:hypothetical protein